MWPAPPPLRREIPVSRTAVLILSTALFAAAAFASEQKLSVADLAREADLIVKARVVDIKTESRGAGQLETLVTLAVEEVWKGTAPPQVTVTVRGGAAGGIAQAVSGEARFLPGEQIIVFLKAKGSSYRVVGGRQGKLVIKIQTDGKDGKEVVQDITGARYVLDKFQTEIQSIP